MEGRAEHAPEPLQGYPLRWAQATPRAPRAAEPPARRPPPLSVSEEEQAAAVEDRRSPAGEDTVGLERLHRTPELATDRLRAWRGRQTDSPVADRVQAETRERDKRPRAL